MSAQFEDILNALCSYVDANQSNDFQKVFMLGDAMEAKLAYDVLIAYGFEAKLYPEDKLSKLYITLAGPDANVEHQRQKLDAGLGHATALKRLKLSLDQLYAEYGAVIQSPEYSVTFANAASGGKQTLILFPSLPLVVPPPAPRPSVTAPAARPATSSGQVKKKTVAKPTAQEDEFGGGPSLAKRTYPKKFEGTDSEEDSLKRQVTLYVKGNMAKSGAFMVMVLVALFVLFSLFMMSKSFLCPDFASYRGNEEKWYCEKKVDPTVDQEIGHTKLRKKDLFQEDAP